MHQSILIGTMVITTYVKEFHLGFWSCKAAKDDLAQIRNEDTDLENEASPPQGPQLAACSAKLGRAPFSCCEGSHVLC